MSGLTVPARTEIEVAIPLTEIAEAALRDYPPGEWHTVSIDVREEHIASYACIDCGYKTNALLMIIEHQREQARHHSLRQRLRRWWALRGKRDRPDVQVSPIEIEPQS